jgi:hypothetical protein
MRTAVERVLPEASPTNRVVFGSSRFDTELHDLFVNVEREVEIATQLLGWG